MAFKTFLALLLLFLSSNAFAAQIKLAWDRPTTKVDGSPLTDLAGYNVYYGTSPGFYDQNIDVPLSAVVENNGVTTYTLTGLTEGRTYFIAVTAYSTSTGWDESGLSNEVTGAIFTVATNPPGLQVVVDSVAYTAPRTFGWEVSSAHSLSVSSAQAGTEGTRYAYNSWDDGGNQEHAITAISYHTETSSEATLTVMNMPTEDLVGYFAFDEGAGSTANDSSSYGNDARVFGAAWAEGKVRGALAFDGVNARVQIPNGPGLGFSSNRFTFAAWVYPTDLSNDRVTIVHRPGAGLGRFGWEICARALDAPTPYYPLFVMDFNGDGIISADEKVEGDIVLDPNRWYFISATYDGAQLNFYIDGTLRGFTPKGGGVIPNSGRDIWIGANEIWGEYFQGKMDEVRIYNRALSQDEIQALMTPGPAQYTLTVNVVGNGSVLKNPDNTQYSPNESVQLTAMPAAGWLFNGWSGGLIGIKNPKNFTMIGNRTVTATFIPQPAAPSITIQPTNQAVIEGQPATFNVLASGFVPFFYQWQQWNGGAWADIYSSNTASYTRPLTTLTDNGARLRCLVMVSANTTYTANYTTQYSLTTLVNPVGGGMVSLSGTNWYDGGQGVLVLATANPGYTFSGWSGGASGAANPVTIPMDGSKTVTANFTTTPGDGPPPGSTVPFTLMTSPVGRQVMVDGVSYTAPNTFNWVPGSTHTLSVPSPQSGATGTRYVFSSWSDGGAQNHTMTAPSASTAYTANFTTQYSLATSVSPSGAGTASPSGTNWYDSGQSIPISATAGSEYRFSGWSGGLTGSANPVSLVMNGPKSVTAKFANIQVDFQISCPDSGIIQCLERTDGGKDSDNLANGKPRADLEFEFKIVVQDKGGVPQHVKLFMTQRSNPQFADLYSYDMSCSGDYLTGANCTYRTKLGPVAVHRFFFEAQTSGGTTVTYPDSGYITGPQVHLLRGYNLVGIPRDINNAHFDGQQAFGNPEVYRWGADEGYFSAVTTLEPVMSGEGYLMYAYNAALDELPAFGEVQVPEYTYLLKPGLNCISNPYSGNVRLSDVKIQKGTQTPVSWQQAASNGWVVNALYYYNGRDWGDTYSHMAAEDGATFVPWLGYWLNLNSSDDAYYLVIPKP